MLHAPSDRSLSLSFFFYRPLSFFCLRYGVIERSPRLQCPAPVGLFSLSLFLSLVQAMEVGCLPPPGFTAQPVLGRLISTPLVVSEWGLETMDLYKTCRTLDVSVLPRLQNCVWQVVSLQVKTASTIPG